MNNATTTTATTSDTNQRRGMSGGAVVAIILTLLICFICASCFGSIALLSSIDTSDSAFETIDGDVVTTTISGESSSENSLLSIPISGPILTNSDLQAVGGLFGVTAVYGYDIKEELIAAAEDTSVSGVILEIDSPGGTIAGSKAVADGVAYYQEQTGNPVVAYCAGSCASGSYMAAISADNVISDVGTVIGSIGVILGPFKFYDNVIAEGDILTGQIVTENGITTRYFSAGESKTLGEPTRKFTEKEIEVLQQSVDDEYERFVDYVAERREDLTAGEIRQEIGALVYSADQAATLGLIDEINTLDGAYEDLAERAGVGEDYRIIRRSLDLGFFELLFGAVLGDQQLSSQSSRASVPSYCVLCTQPLVFYGDARDLYGLPTVESR